MYSLYSTCCTPYSFKKWNEFLIWMEIYCRLIYSYTCLYPDWFNNYFLVLPNLQVITIRVAWLWRSCRSHYLFPTSFSHVSLYWCDHLCLYERFLCQYFYVDFVINWPSVNLLTIQNPFSSEPFTSLWFPLPLLAKPWVFVLIFYGVFFDFFYSTWK